MPQQYNLYNFESGFRQYLLAGNQEKNLQSVSVKNYLSDFRHFAGWFSSYFTQKQRISTNLNEFQFISLIDQETITNYKLYLIDCNLPVKTINRRLSTLRKFCSFCISQGWLTENPAKKVANAISVKTGIQGNNETPVLKNDIKQTVEEIDRISEFKIKDLRLKNKDLRLAIKELINNISQSLIEKFHKTDRQSLIFNPQSSGFGIQHYIGLIIILIFMAVLGAGIYNRFFVKQTSSLAYPTSLQRAGRLLSFQGRLTDTIGNPITTATNVTFKLYNVSTGGSALYNTGACSTTPDQDGIFNVLIGGSGYTPTSPQSVCGTEPDATIFSENPNVYLGVTVGADSEMTPRQQIANVGYAINAETLQGYPPGITINSVPYINNSGDLLMAASAPSLRSTYASATFALTSANAVTIQSAGTGNINLAATGSGTLNFQTGATPTTQMIVTNGGNVGIGTTAPGYKFDVNGSANATTLYQAGNQVCDLSGNCTAGTGYWSQTSGLLYPKNSTVDFAIGGTATSSAKFAFINVNSGNPTASISGNLALVSPTGANPSNSLNSLNGGSLNFQTSVGGDAGLTSRLFVNNVGNVGVGTTTPAAGNKLHVEGQCVAEGTLIRRRRKKKNGEYEDEDIPVEDIESGDEIMSLNEATGEFEYQTVEKTMDMGMQDTYLLITETGKRIRTTANHPYLAQKPDQSISGTFEVDQSNRLEDFSKHSYIAIANSRFTKIILLTRQTKLNLMRKYQKPNYKTKLFAPTLWARTIAYLINESHIRKAKLILDKEYSGYENIIEQIIKNNTQEIYVEFKSVGKNSPAHQAVYAANPKTKGQKKLTGALGVTQVAEDALHPEFTGISKTPSSQVKKDYHTIKDLSTPLEKELTLTGSRGKWTKVYDLRIGQKIATVNGWEKILFLGKSGREQTYDLQIARTHNFVANKIVAHNTYINGNLGIGTTAPSELLHVQGGANQGIRIASTLNSPILDFYQTNLASADARNWRIAGNSNAFGTLEFQVSTANNTAPSSTGAKVVITKDGNVGIGTTAPGYKFDVNGSANATTLYQAGNQVCDLSGNCTAGTGYWSQTSGLLYPKNSTVDFAIGGTATSSAKFAFMNVNSGNPTASISGNLALVSPTGANPSNSLNSLNGGSINLQTSVGGDASLTSRLFIANNGNIGIGTTTPAAGNKLHVEGQCVAEGTLIEIRRRRKKRRRNSDDKNEYDYLDIPVEDVLPGDEVMSLNEKTNEFEYQTVEKIMDKGMQTSYELTTESGKHIETTANHPYLIRNKDINRWMKVKELKKGQEIATLGSKNKFIEKPVYLFVDETGIFEGSNQTYMGVGGFELFANFSEMNQELRNILLDCVNALPNEKEKQFEFKFTYITERSLKFYEKLLDILEKYQHAWSFSWTIQPRSSSSYWRQYLFLLRHLLTRQERKIFVLADYLNRPNKSERKIENLATLRNINGILQIESQGSVFLQLADILLGAIAFTISRGKDKLNKKIVDRVVDLLLKKERAGVSPSLCRSRSVRNSFATGTSLTQAINNVKTNKKDGYKVTLYRLSAGAAPSLRRDDLTMPEGDSFIKWEKIVSIKKMNRKQMYDLQIANTHNFVANKIVAHNTYINGNLGIGTTAPADKLSVAGGYVDVQTGYGFTFGSRTDTGLLDSGGLNTILAAPDHVAIQIDSNNTDTNRYFSFRNNGISYNDGTEIMRVEESGNVGIGTTGPTSKLSVSGNIKVAAGSSLGAWNTADETTNSEQVYLGFASNIATLATTKDGAGTFRDFRIRTGDTDRLYVQSTGNVGIGTTGPNFKLDVAGTGRIQSTNALYFGGTGASDAVGSIYAPNTTDLQIGANAAAAKIYLQGSGGNVGIGTTAPGYKFDVNGSANATTLYQAGNQVCDLSGNCTAGTGYWSQTSGLLYPKNSTVDFAIGGTATSSAKFAFMNVNSGNPTASISGNLALVSPTGANPSNSLNSLNGGSINLQTSVGGDAGLTSRLFVNNVGNVGVGTTTPAAGNKLHVEGQCVAEGTLIRRRRKKKNGEYEDEDIPVEDIESGDEIMSLNEATGEFEYQTVEKTMDMGMQDTYLLITETGKRIRTTANHPYLAQKPDQMISGTFEVDQSNRFEDLSKDSYLAIANLKQQFILKISKTEKRNAFVHYQREPKKFGPIMWGRSIAYLMNYYHLKNIKLVLDDEYKGYEKLAKQIIETYSHQLVSLEVRSIGKNSPAHLAAYRTNPKTLGHKKMTGALAQYVQVAEDMLHPEFTGIRISSSQVKKEYHTIKDLSTLLEKELTLTGSRGKWTKVYDLRIGQKIATVNGWEKILFLGKSGREQTYDLQIARTHNFVANKIVAHNTYINGNLGIGTTGPGAKLEVAGNIFTSANTNYLLFGTNAATNPYVSGGSNNYLYLGTANNARVTIDTTGNVGIGTTGPTQKLEVAGKVKITGSDLYGPETFYMGVSDSERKFYWGSSTYMESDNDISLIAAGNLYLNSTGTAGTEMTITNAGNVGIGTTAPTQKLDIAGNATVSGTLALGPQTQQYAGTCNVSSAGKQYYDGAGNQFYYCNGTSWTVVGTGSGIGGSGTATYIPKFTASTTLGNSAIYDASGNIGIGTTGPTAKLHLYDTTVGTGIYSYENRQSGDNYAIYGQATGPSANLNVGGIFAVSGGTTNYAINIPANYPAAGANNYAIYSASQAQSYISGNVGIGTTGPTYKLHVIGNSLFNNTANDGVAVYGYQSGGTGTVYGVYGQNASSAATSGVGVIGVANQAITRNVGLMGYATGGTNNIQLLLGASTPTGTGNYAIYSSGTSDSYIAGNVGIGTTGPGELLHILGTPVSEGGLTTLLRLDDSTSMAAGVGGGIRFVGNFTAGGGKAGYGAIKGIKENATDSNYAGALAFYSRPNGGSFQEQMRISSAGNVGIGTTNPLAPLHVNGNIISTITLGNIAGKLRIQPDGTGFMFGTTADGYAPLHGDSIKMEGTGSTNYILGNVGIGTTAPSQKLDIAGNATVSGTLALGPQTQQYAGTCNVSSAGKQYYDGAGNQFYYCNGTSWTVVGTGSGIGGSGTATYIPKFTASTTLGNSAIYDASGNIGIGTTGPAYKLVVSGSGGVAAFGTATDATYFGSGTGYGEMVGVDINGSAYNALQIRTGATPTMYFDTSGNVGIGVTDPSYKLHLEGDLGGGTSTSYERPALTFSNWGYSAGYRVLMLGSSSTSYSTNHTGSVTLSLGADVTANASGSFTGDGREILVRNLANFTQPNAANNSYYTTLSMNDGNVGINTPTPTAKLDVAGDASLSGHLVMRGTTPNYLHLLNGTDFRISTSPGGDTGNVDRLTLLANGNVGIGTTGPGDKLDVSEGNLIFTDVDVAHGVTGWAPTNANGKIGIAQGNFGGLDVLGISDSASQFGARLYGVIGVADPQDEVPAVVINSGKANGTSVQALGSAETALQIRNYTTNLVTVLGSGNVGIGTTGPGSILHTYKSSSGTGMVSTNPSVVTITNSGGTLGEFSGVYFDGWTNLPQGAIGTVKTSAASSGLSDMVFGVKSAATASDVTEYMRIQGGGNVGIGTTAPAHKLEVKSAPSNDTADNGILIDYDPTFTTTGTYYYKGLDSNVDMLGTAGQKNNGYLQGLSTTIFSGVGNLASLYGAGITYGHYTGDTGTTDNVYGLRLLPYQMAGTITNSYGLFITAPSTGGTVTNEWAIYSEDDAKSYFAGNVGIGTTAPFTLLDVQKASPSLNTFYSILGFGSPSYSSAVDIADIGINRSGTGWNDGDLAIRTHTQNDGTLYEAVTIQGSGNVGIGTTGPGAKLDVAGTLYTTGQVIVGNNGDTNLLTRHIYGKGSGNNNPDYLYLNYGQDGMGVQIGDSGNNHELIVYGTGTFGTNARINGGGVSYFNGGNVGIGTTAPTQKLDIAGNATTSGTLALGPQTQQYAGTCNVSSAGKQYYDGAGNQFYYCNGTSWTVVGTGSGIGGSGTATYIPKFTASTTLGNSAIYDASGNIGIGTTGPASKLQVSDTTSRTSNQGTAYGILDLVGSSSNGQFYRLTFSDANIPKGAIGVNKTASGSLMYFGTSNSYASGITNDAMVIDYSGNVGIGTTGPGAKLHVSGGDILLDNATYLRAKNGAGTIRSVLTRYSDNVLYMDGDQIQFRVNDETGQANAVRILANGNVGIGTTGPGAALDVHGTVIFNPSNGAVDSHFFTSSNGAGTYYIRDDAGNSDVQISAVTNLATYFNNGGNVGIGTTAPGVKLDVVNSAGSSYVRTTNSYANGTAGFRSANTTNDWFSGVGYSALGGKYEIYDVTNTASRLTIDTSGNVGIGTTGPGAKLEVAGVSRLGSAATQIHRLYGLTDYVPRNILRNGDFENWSAGTSTLPTFWTYDAGGGTYSISRDTTNVEVGYGGASANVNVTSFAALYYYSHFYQGTLPNSYQKPNTVYTIVARIKYLSRTGSPTLKLVSDSPTSIDTSNREYNFTTGGWQTLSYTFQSGASTGGSYAGYIQALGTGAGGEAINYVVSEVSVYEGYAGFPVTPSLLADGGAQTLGGLDNSNPLLTIDQQGTADILRLNNTGTNRLTVQAGGNVGIGTTGPGAKLDVSGAAGTWISQITSIGTNTQTAIKFGANEIAGPTQTGVMDLMSGTTTAIRLNANSAGASWINAGNVGIGTTGPAVRLDLGVSTDIVGADQVFGLRTNANSRFGLGTSDQNMMFYVPSDITSTSGFVFGTIASTDGSTFSEKVRIDRSGNVGIGTTAPGQKLAVEGTLGILEGGASPSYHTIFQGGDQSADITYTLPTAQGTANSTLANNGSGTLSWFNPMGGTGINGFWQRTSNSLAPANITDSLNLGNTASTSAYIHLAGTANDPSWFNSGNIGIGTTAPNSGNCTSTNKACVNGDLTASTFLDYNNTGFYLNPAGDSLLSSITFDDDLGVAGSAQISAVSGTMVLDGTASTDVCIGPSASCNGKIDAGTVDPPYTINGKKYATYLSAMTGVKEETTGIITISNIKNQISNSYEYNIDFSNQGEASDLWLFSKTTNLKENINRMSVLLTPSDNTKVWYKIDKNNYRLTIYSSRPTTISYRLTAPRFDSENWQNTRADGGSGFVINDEDKPISLNNNGSIGSLDKKPYASIIKSEILNSKLETNSNSQNQNDQNNTPDTSLVLNLENSNFDIVSDLVLRASNFTTQLNTGEIVEEIGTYAEAFISKIHAGLIEASNIIINNLLVAKNIIAETISVNRLFIRENLFAEKIISPIVETQDIIATGTAQLNTIATNEIKPQNSDIIINLQPTPYNLPPNDKGALARLIIKGLEGKTAAVIDEAGNATFSGTLAAESVIASSSSFLASSIQHLTSNDASVSGTLVAGNIQADNINQLEGNVASQSSSIQNLSSNINDVQKLLANIKNSPLPDTTNSTNLSNLTNSTFDQLTVSGQSNLYNLSVSGSLMVGQTMIENNAILSLASNLKLSALSTITLFDGSVVIAKDGTITTQGTLIAQGGVRTNEIKAINDQDNVNINNLAINNLTINDKYMDATQSGAIIAASDNLVQNGINSPAIQTQAQTAGIGVLPANQSEVIIYNDSVKNNSLIYLTPTTLNSPQLTIAEKVAEGKSYFKVTANSTSHQNIQFNWLIIN